MLFGVLPSCVLASAGISIMGPLGAWCVRCCRVSIFRLGAVATEASQQVAAVKPVGRWRLSLFGAWKFCDVAPGGNGELRGGPRFRSAPSATLRAFSLSLRAESSKILAAAGWRLRCRWLRLPTHGPAPELLQDLTTEDIRRLRPFVVHQPDEPKRSARTGYLQKQWHAKLGSPPPWPSKGPCILNSLQGVALQDFLNPEFDHAPKLPRNSKSH